MIIDIKHIDIKHDEDKTLIENVSFNADKGSFIFIVGRVGAGKSTLLRTIHGEYCPYRSETIPEEEEAIVKVLDYDLLRIKRRRMQELRREVGYVFQNYRLLGSRTIAQNLGFVLRATGWKNKQERLERINQVLEAVGLADKGNKYPHELSGGEQQRAAIARALLNRPKILLADEPTGNLDAETGNQILDLLHYAAEQGTAVIIVTHNMHLLQRFDCQVYHIENKQLLPISAEEAFLTLQQESNAQHPQ
ncbi:MAG: ATP-binding cassette domain-containing protein [Alloprevotella sp.]|nr:ATP-binding cassette domain-containing protein [Alloprevotella sp.]